MDTSKDHILNTMTMKLEDIMVDGRPQWPQWAYDMFPMIYIFYKPRKPKERKRKAGFEVVSVEKVPGKAPRYTWKAKKVHYKKYSTRQQNNLSYATCIILDPNGYGTVRRSLRHKGYSVVVGAVYATDDEIAREKDCWRYRFYFFKAMEKFYNVRKIDDPRLRDVCEQIAREYPSHASGQLRLH